MNAVVNIYPELCCDHCGEVIHTHFDCPVCRKGFEPTSMYADSYLDAKSFECERCHTEFTVLSRAINFTGPDTMGVEWTAVKPKENVDVEKIN